MHSFPGPHVHKRISTMNFYLYRFMVNKILRFSMMRLNSQKISKLYIQGVLGITVHTHVRRRIELDRYRFNIENSNLAWSINLQGHSDKIGQNLISTYFQEILIVLVANKFFARHSQDFQNHQESIKLMTSKNLKDHGKIGPKLWLFSSLIPKPIPVCQPSCGASTRASIRPTPWLVLIPGSQDGRRLTAHWAQLLPPLRPSRQTQMKRSPPLLSLAFRSPKLDLRWLHTALPFCSQIRGEIGARIARKKCVPTCFGTGMDSWNGINCKACCAISGLESFCLR